MWILQIKLYAIKFLALLVLEICLRLCPIFKGHVILGQAAFQENNLSVLSILLEEAVYRIWSLYWRYIRKYAQFLRFTWLKPRLFWKKFLNTVQVLPRSISYPIMKCMSSFLDPEGGSPNPILVVVVVVVVVVVINSLKMLSFLIRSGAQRNFAYTFVLTFPTDLQSQILN